MKRIFPILILSAAMLTSCLEGGSNYTPSITVSNFLLTTGDTLHLHYNSKADYYYLDTIKMGDTVRFAAGFASYANNIVYTGIDWDKSKLQTIVEFDPKFLEITTEKSDTANLQLYFQTGYNFVAIPGKLTPLSAGEATLTFAVESDAEKVDNTFRTSLRIITK